jgi:hypothetical protein
VNRKLVLLTCVVAMSSLSVPAFSQGSMVPQRPLGGFNSNGTYNYGGATDLVTGISFGVNNSMTGSETLAKDFDQYSFRPIIQSGRMFAYGTEYNIKGNRFLFDEWVRGVVVKNSGQEIKDDKYLFNFDKVTNNLLVTVDKKGIIEVFKDSIQSFQFKEKGQVYNFKKLPAIQKYRFVQVLVENPDKYSIYKTTNTRFVGADYNTDGLTESGHPYDEYVDKDLYYIMLKSGEIRPVQLSFSSIKKALKENSSQAKDYYADHLMDEVDENYLTNIVEYVNQ